MCYELGKKIYSQFCNWNWWTFLRAIFDPPMIPKKNFLGVTEEKNENSTGQIRKTWFGQISKKN